MSMFGGTFDVKSWIREHGLPRRGRSLILHLDASHLDATIQIPSCASWDFPDLGVGQGQWDQHQGFRGTLTDLLETSRRDVERNQGMYGEAAKPQFDAVLKQIDQLLQSEDGVIHTVTLSVHDPSGLCSVPKELLGCIVKDMRFERTQAEKMMLTPKDFPDPGEQLSSVESIAELVRRATNVVALTGAGISVESGITPFRNPSDGDKGSIWGTFDAGKMTVQNFNADPEIAKAWWAMKRTLVKEMHQALPNAAHTFFEMLEQQGKLGAVVTQNIDSLHQKSGVSAEKVIELHGHMRGLICSDHHTELNPVTFRNGACTFSIPADDVDAIKAAYEDADEVPMCPDCGCPLRTETVMFGQPMPLPAVEAATKAIDDADLLFIIGSTLIVQPANELPCLALQNGAPVVMINFDGTQYDTFVKGLVRQKAGVFLDNVADELKRRPVSTASAKPLRPVHSGVGKVQEMSPEQVKHKSIDKEGRRCGKEISMNTKACGISFFCTAVSEPQGDFGLLEQSLTAMHPECVDIGKMIFSDGLEQLAVVAVVPDVLVVLLSPKSWLQAVANAIGGSIVEEKDNSAKLMVPAGPNAHPIKLKEAGITAAINFLKEKGLFPIDDSDDDIIYGEHDFPS